MNRTFLAKQRIQVEGNAVLKQTALGKVQVSLLQQAHALSLQSRSFYVPKVLDYEERSRRVKLEYLPGLIPVRRYIGQHQDVETVLDHIGHALATCHGRLQLRAGECRLAVFPWDGKAEQRVVVHGDFNADNVCIHPDRKGIVILDWETSPAFHYYWNYGTRYLDLVQFIRSLLLQQESLVRSLGNFRRWTQVFLHAYQQTGGVQLDRKTINDYLCLYNQAAWKKQWKRNRYLSWLHSRAGRYLFPSFLNQIDLGKPAESLF